MLAIQHEPLYKNKYFLSTVAVSAGFFVTVGIIRLANPVDTSTNQSAQASSDRRAASLIPINASESESSSESGKKTDESPESTTGGTDQNTWITPATTTTPQQQSPASTEPAATPQTTASTTSITEATAIEQPAPSAPVETIDQCDEALLDLSLLIVNVCL